MISKIKKTFLFLFLILLLPVPAVRADTGPKPTMDFQFQQDLSGGPLTITSGILYECEQPDCSDAAPLAELGPQRFTCEANSCYAMSYGFSPYHRLEIEFSDGQTLQSNIFETAGFNSKYTVTVRPEDLLVEAQFNLVPSLRTILSMVVCLCALAGLGLLVGAVVFVRRRRATA
jgi:hypothetical protein